MKIWIAALDAHNNGGITTHITALTKELTQLGHEVDWITPGGEIVEQLASHVVKMNQQLFKNYPNNLSVDIIETWALCLEMNFRLKIIEEKPDIIHCHDVIAYQRLKLIAESHSLPIVLTVHGHIPDEEVNHGHITENSVEYDYWRKTEWFALKELRHIISVGNELKEYLENIYPSVQIMNIPNFIHRDFTKIELQNVRSELGIDDKTFLIFCPSRYETIKGIDYLLEALVSLPAKAVLLLIDNGTIGLSQQIDHKQLQNRVKVIKPVPNTLMSSLYASADLCVLPSIKIGSKTETSSLSAMESMIMGTPVLASNVGGLKEVVEGGGKLVPMQDSHALAEEILRFMTSEEELSRYKNLASVRSDSFKAETVVPRLVEVYEAAIHDYEVRFYTPFLLYGFSAKVLQMIFLTILNKIEEIKELLDFSKVRFGIHYRLNLLESYSIIINSLPQNFEDIKTMGKILEEELREYIKNR
ncbi:glycosyltransferase family 4 protein [Paenibacillus chitinolyticus]|uniref:glycosyltransferase family 4 protein n=1 Tax=Paenibacillus chitinolyticus TaxID=79263 RepID=UPI00364E8CFE